MNTAMARWARERNIPRPTTDEGMRVLRARFMADMKSRHAAAQQVVGAVAETQAAPSAYVEFNGAFSEIRDPLRVGENDDFHEMVQQRNEAMHEGKGDDLARDVILQEQSRAALGQSASFVRINPASSIKAVLGGIATLTTPATNAALQTLISNAQQVAMWVADDNSETVAITVTFGPIATIIQLVNQLNPSELRPFGVVQFGTRGALQTVEVDIGRGCQLTVSGTQVNVSVALDAPSLGNVQNTTTLTGMISFYPIQKHVGLQRTRYVDALAAGVTTGKLVVPPFARDLTIYNSGVTSNNPSVNSTAITFYNSAGVVTQSTQLQPNIYSQYFALDNQTYSLTLKNDDGSHAVNYACVFGLTL